MLSANGGIGSSPFGLARFHAKMRPCTSCMKRWKWMRRFSRTSAASKNKSISMDLPRPTSPTRYSPFGRDSLDPSAALRRRNRANNPVDACVGSGS